ncbi:Rid family detoxifying hydrolase [Variovorax sp. M-6]|uniref:Rid family detoxifying hydrolase n=1 Tax=Variovorax sp. M-6 TaxID=3233041 RepID=UPI003F9E569E
MHSTQAITSPDAPEAIGPYSQAIAAGGFLYVSGQLPLTKASVMPRDIGEQARVSLQNLEAVARSANGSLRDVVKFTVYMTDLSEFQTVNEVMASVLVAPYPARSTVGVASLPKGAQIEIEAVLKLADPKE